MNLFELTVEALKGMTIDVSRIKRKHLDDAYDEIVKSRREFRRDYRGTLYNTKPLHDAVMARLKRVIKNRGDNEELNKHLRELQARPESDPLRMRVAEIIEDQYILDQESIVKLKEIIGIDESHLCFDVPTEGYCRERSLEFCWDLDSEYKLIPSELMRVTEEKGGEEDNHDYMSIMSGPDPDHYDGWSLLKVGEHRVLLRIQYKDYCDSYSHGDDLCVSVLFDVHRRLNALLLDPILTKPSPQWIVRTRSYTV